MTTKSKNGGISNKEKEITAKLQKIALTTKSQRTLFGSGDGSAVANMGAKIGQNPIAGKRKFVKSREFKGIGTGSFEETAFDNNLLAKEGLVNIKEKK